MGKRNRENTVHILEDEVSHVSFAAYWADGASVFNRVKHTLNISGMVTTHNCPTEKTIFRKIQEYYKFRVSGQRKKKTLPGQKWM